MLRRIHAALYFHVERRIALCIQGSGSLLGSAARNPSKVAVGT